MAENIYPIFEKMLQRKDREALLKQKGIMIWFTGLSGSGKSTLAIALEGELYKQGILCRILDGDNIRSGINNNLGFSEADRTENIRRIAEVSKLFVDCGIVTIAAFISPTHAIRRMASEIIGEDDFLEVYVSTPIEECERRDVIAFRSPGTSVYFDRHLTAILSRFGESFIGSRFSENNRK